MKEEPLITKLLEALVPPDDCSKLTWYIYRAMQYIFFITLFLLVCATITYLIGV